MDDPFEEINNLNASSYDEGYKEGILNGKKEAILQGFKIGKNTCINLAKELGSIYGACQLFKHQNKNQSEEKCFKVAGQICELIEKFDVTNCHSDSFSNEINLIKDKYKQFCSLTNSRYSGDQTRTEAKISKFNF